MLSHRGVEAGEAGADSSAMPRMQASIASGPMALVNTMATGGCGCPWPSSGAVHTVRHNGRSRLASGRLFSVRAKNRA
ncbi:hypothetical protein ACIGD1_26000 [Streptomyces sp. NPDC085612]|uniref:hypothetical protein n=1 Tax=Streptomyces sp. NPDC085612 TaxID=3365732 RepID=UPI0037D0F832